MPGDDFLCARRSQSSHDADDRDRLFGNLLGTVPPGSALEVGATISSLHFLAKTTDEDSMQKNEFNVLIVEDDRTLGKALQEALNRSGFKTTLVTKPDDALTNARLQPVHFAIIDCMLPKMNGRDLAKKLHQDVLVDTPILLISGIYKDKNFAREAVNATGAIGFLTKPFDLASVIQLVESRIESKGVEMPLAPIQSVITKENASHKERIRAINETEEVHAFELPLIYSLLMHPRINGHLNIISADGEVSGVGFQKGNIVQVNQKDAKSYFGVLMIENGFIHASRNRRSHEGQRQNPQDGRTARRSQCPQPARGATRDGGTTGFAPEQDDREHLGESEFHRKRRHARRRHRRPADLHGPAQRLAQFKDHARVAQGDLPPVDALQRQARSRVRRPTPLPDDARFCNAVPDFFTQLVASDTLDGAMERLGLPGGRPVPRPLHALVVGRVVRFGEASQDTDYEGLRKRLIKIDTDLDKQNHFERLNVSAKAKESEIKRAYHDLAKILHPDKLAPGTPTDARNLARKAFNKINEAYQTLSDPELKSKYQVELEKGRAESVLEAEQLTEQARVLLSKGDIRNGREAMEKAVALAPPTSEMRLLHIWARLKTQGSENDMGLFDLIRGEIARIPPEDRHVATYYFVKGLFLKATGETEAAKRSLEHAVSLSPEFIDARRELSAMDHQRKAGSSDLLRGDLKDVVGMLFKKEKIKSNFNAPGLRRRTKSGFETRERFLFQKAISRRPASPRRSAPAYPCL